MVHYDSKLVRHLLIYIFNSKLTFYPYLEIMGLIFYVNFLALLEISNCPKLKMLPSRFPKLEHLKIKGCDSLKALPGTPVLKVLVLVDNPVLEVLNEEHDYLSSRLDLKISGFPKVEIGEERRKAHREIEIQSVINTESSSVPSTSTPPGHRLTMPSQKG